MLEDRIAVAKGALRSVQGEYFAGMQVHGIQAVKTVLQFYAVGANVLHRASAHTAGNKGQVLQPWPALLQCPAHDFVPVFTGSCLHNPVFIGLVHQFAAHDLDFECQGLDITCQHNIATAAQNKGRVGSEIVAGYGLAQVVHIANAQQLQGFSDYSKAIMGLQGYIFFN